MRAIHNLALAALLIMSTQIACAQDLDGEWATQGYSARVRIGPCPHLPTSRCGEITWLWEPTDANGAPFLDVRNSQVKLRERPLIGLPLLNDFRRATATKWTEGSIYDPESGRTYRATLTSRSHDVLEVVGCFLFVCRTQIWRRVDSLCAL